MIRLKSARMLKSLCPTRLRLLGKAGTSFVQQLGKANFKLRKWWNWQTHHLEGVAPKGVGVQIPPSAPKSSLFELKERPAIAPVRLTIA